MEGPINSACVHENIDVKFVLNRGGSTFHGTVMDRLLPLSVMDGFRRTAKSLNGYANGVKLTKKVFAKLASRLQRTAGIEWWSVRIVPHPCIQLAISA